MITIDRRDLEFQLFDLLALDDLQSTPRYVDYDRAAIEAALDTAERLGLEYFEPLAAQLDEREPRFIDGKVDMLAGAAEALGAYRDAGFFGAGFEQRWGGSQMPETLGCACGYIFSSANIGLAAYPLLTKGAANLIASFGTDAQRERFLRPMVEGRYFGTMCLSEPQAGSSLSDIATVAERQPDGSFRIRGRKMWISGGDQEISENIVHMVLAKVPGAPAGAKGISLFIVPKYLVSEDGRLEGRNGVALAGLNHKMGYRGTTNTLLNFGEDAPCTAYLLGEENKGLAYMFQMMNEARIAVGLGATALAAAGYSVSKNYARERTQGRHPDKKRPDLPQVPIIEHADIKRLLLAQKVAVEGALALLLYTAMLVDRIRTRPEDAGRNDDELVLDLLTPIAKSWPSEFCLEANKHAIQILGGYGYARDYPVERLYRDNRLNAIHEGTHGIQAIDLLGRKIPYENRAGFSILISRMQEEIRQAQAFDSLREEAEALDRHLLRVTETTGILLAALAERPRLALANATIYLDMMGHSVIAWMWLRQAVCAARQLRSGDGDGPFLQGKLAAFRYFMNYELPKARTQCDILNRIDDMTVSVDPDWL
ncbi:acyl-CoA dehydrogenase [Bosea sp. (in: a-proteobacteria)]|uniref:acyl-CoA dehydrogenase n=1 Tax=Bosea sp. (in: a-proteobacteria) TaxID=1871050 RepID=UPI0026127E37|nr:acyl-CoA dehydrogenase [Bosea sp. (in: a-proteobacteria)]MCO5089644.1 acyl-CoA dehydrogenase [Bosea sp. (in: a-proteobacteria)]